MPRATPVPVWQAILQRRQQGHSLNSIVQKFDISIMTVRSPSRRLRDCRPEAITPDSAGCAHPGPKAHPELVQAACQLKRDHPTWGAVLIRIPLQPRWPDRSLPHPRTLQRWFRDAGLSRPPRRRPPQDRRPGPQPPELWQVDAVEKQRLADGHLASWLTVTNELSGAILTAELSPREPWQEVDPLDGQQVLRRTFQSWGWPDRVRVDDGHPWGSRNDRPRELAWWLIGLGVGMIWNKPSCPQRNGVVERTQGVTEPWLRDRESMPERLVWAIPIQRAVYPAIDGGSRLEAFLRLLTPWRPYRIEQEEQLWELDRIDEYMR
jgi:hypothetical protein